MYLEKINIMLDTYAPLKIVVKYKLRLKSKPRITLGLQKPISIKNKLLTKFINTKHSILKEQTYIEYKSYRNLLSTPMKKSKQVYYNKYFETNWNNIKNTWKVIRSLTPLKTVASSAPTVLSRDNGNTITDPYDIVKNLNNYFASIAENIKNNIKYSRKYFSDYLKDECDGTKFLQPNSKKEITNIISSLNSNKTSSPESIPYSILFLLKHEVSMQLADLFNLSFKNGIFRYQSVLKTEKVVPICKKDSKPDHSNYRPNFLLSNIKKILENLMYKRLYTFLSNNNILTYNLVSDSIILHHPA